MVGAVYAANTLGAIFGAVTFSIIVIPALGTLWAQRILIAVAAMAAMVILVARMRAAIRAGYQRLEILGGLIAVPAVAAVFCYGVPPVPGELYAFGRTIMNPDYTPAMLYVERA